MIRAKLRQVWSAPLPWVVCLPLLLVLVWAAFEPFNARMDWHRVPQILLADLLALAQ